jgi:hypothetical protein
VKLLDWIKGAVGFTKAPDVQPVAEPPPRAPERVDAHTELRPQPPPPVNEESAPPGETTVEAPTGVRPQKEERPQQDAQAEREALLAAEAPEPTIARTQAQPAEPQARPSAEAASPPSLDEIERRRAMVRRFFNDYWSSIEDKPASFAERLDGAEGYINERVAAGGETWQLDPAIRKQLGLPPHRRRGGAAPP